MTVRSLPRRHPPAIADLPLPADAAIDQRMSRSARPMTCCATRSSRFG